MVELSMDSLKRVHIIPELCEHKTEKKIARALLHCKRK